MATPVLFSSRIACRSDHNGKYLRCVYDQREHGIRIDASAERVAGSARTRFIVEKFDEGRRLVHIRCAYNYKYWVPEKVDNGGWVIGTANEPEANLYKPSSTLFEYVHVSGNSFRFFHIGLQKYACIADETKTCLQLKESGSNTFNVIGLSHQKELPKYVVFKGPNGRYLHVQSYIYLWGDYTAEIDEKWKHDPKYAFLKFGQKDKGHPSVLHTTSTNDEGLVRIRCLETGMFWKYHPDFLRAGSWEDNFNDTYTLFKVVSAGDGFTALQNVGGKLFCKMLSGYGDGNAFNDHKKIDCLGAEVDWIGPAEKLTVEEPVRDRNIYDVMFHVDEARIHDMGSLPETEQVHRNPHDLAESDSISFARKRSVNSKWETSISLKTSEEVKSSFSVGVELPLLKKGNFKFQGDYSRTEYIESTTVEERGGSQSGTDEVTQTHNFTVPPKTISTVKLVTRQLHYDIPFSYKESAVLLKNGEELEPVFHDDGLYSVTERYTSYDIYDEPLK